MSEDGGGGKGVGKGKERGEGDLLAKIAKMLMRTILSDLGLVVVFGVWCLVK